MEEENKTEETKNTEQSKKLDDKVLSAALGALGAGMSLFPSNGKFDITVNVQVGDKNFNYYREPNGGFVGCSA